MQWKDFPVCDTTKFRELLRVKFVLHSYGDILNNQAIKINVDNFGATRILTLGSSKVDLQQLATEIFFHCLRKNIKADSTRTKWLEVTVMVGSNRNGWK